MCTFLVNSSYVHIERRKREGSTSVSPSRDNVGDALSTQKETNYASHAESPNRGPERVIHGAGSKSKIPIEEEVGIVYCTMYTMTVYCTMYTMTVYCTMYTMT